MKAKLFAVLLLALAVTAASPHGFAVDVPVGDTFRYSYSGGIGEVSWFSELSGKYWLVSCFYGDDASVHWLGAGKSVDETAECPRIERPEADGQLHVSSGTKNLLKKIFVPFVQDGN